jgi:hypothetical protein
MRRLVEDAGEPFYAGWLSRFFGLTGQRQGFEVVGNREVEWELDESDVVIVTHPAADRKGKPICYRVGLEFTDMPCGGSRWWWSCPACRARVDVLYLPTDRDRFACRKCCGLVYASQYPSRKVRRRKRRSTVSVVCERKEWTAATGWVLLSRHTRSR